MPADPASCAAGREGQYHRRRGFLLRAADHRTAYNSFKLMYMMDREASLGEESPVTNDIVVLASEWTRLEQHIRCGNLRRPPNITGTRAALPARKEL